MKVKLLSYGPTDEGTIVFEFEHRVSNGESVFYRVGITDDGSDTLDLAKKALQNGASAIRKQAKKLVEAGVVGREFNVSNNNTVTLAD